ncbi:hypothetical protein Taro_028386 [Colocasia esculenta]|uniref:Uncharacterized protein n=1 Tax=Colocasia esculenta TaxID=4460 RepID=A0A843VMZ9_COLES|nr:hypothetical protein [Colocasia esculenta]
MASRGRRGRAPACEDEPRRDERAEQQAPAPQGPVLPPPPPVDYGVFMQGLVQAMQMQAHTQAALQAQLEAQASTPWTPTLIPASSNVDANFSDLHVLQSPEFRKQATPTIGELSPMTGTWHQCLDAKLQVCVQRSCRPLLERPETAAKFI